MKDTKVQWHPGFVAAMNLELAKNRDDLIFVKEYNLNTKPLEVDLLVIKKDKCVATDNEIGAIFRGHNILEYKSPQDHLDIDTFYKVGAYASLYKSYGETVDSIKADDITVSLVRDAKPVELFRYFEKHQYTITTPYRGVYYIEGMVLFPTQIIVTKELERDTHIWLKALSDRIEKRDMEELLKRISRLTEQGDRELADSVLEVSAQVNREVLEELKGDDNMSEALLEIFMPIVEPLIEARIEPLIEARMEPLIETRVEEGKKQGKKEGKKEGIQGTVDVLRDLGHGDIEISEIIQKKYGLTNEEVAEYI
ncbi:MAG: hypothetical protein K1W31_03660 [Lachnospiraceae bacterium]|jgi:hypothetical protein|nr:hypothetical protein [Lachnospiraceae bacterium]